MASLTREEILARKADLPREIVDAGELGGTVYVRVLTLREVDEIQKAQKVTDSGLMMYPRIVQLSCVDDSGAQIFGKEDLDMIDSLPFSVVDRIARHAMRLSGMMDDGKGKDGEGDPGKK